MERQIGRDWKHPVLRAAAKSHAPPRICYRNQGSNKYTWSHIVKNGEKGLEKISVASACHFFAFPKDSGPESRDFMRIAEQLGK
ncbi:mortality factor 4-like protein 1-like [Platysternon megacephalum]|uniref:Mortality factor 4-like protein 1-like n=1 Tax=Platysternon megacephalum TaxID=55544 RepID=A0A4D9DIN9_9SAUR|nr:mortality factor 4-like protein 1-like [Platysternon megacephalum]